MIKPSSSSGSGSGEPPSSAEAHRKRQARTSSAPLDEDPAASLEHASPFLFVPSMLPINLIAALILPYVQDRSTWNSFCCASKESRDAGKRMRPPWPTTTLNVGGGTSTSSTAAVRAVAFSPCKSFLACSSEEHDLVHVWDRHGEQTRLEGHTGGVTCLEYSLDGNYLASGSLDKSIRLWHTPMTSKSESAAAHSSSSSDESRNNHRDASRGILQALVSDIILLGHGSVITSLAFSPTDSNLLASGCVAGEIKLWDVSKQVCIHASHPRQLSIIENIFFSPGDNMQCYVVTRRGPMIRIVRNKRTMEFVATILDETSLGKFPNAAFSPCGTCFAAISDVGGESKRELALFDLRTMAKTQSVVLSDHTDVAGFAMSPDGKKLATVNRSGGTRLFECHDLTIQTYVDTIEEHMGIFWRWPVAFDSTSRLFAVGCFDGRVELRSI
jgi:WD40 repeat protein